MTNQYVETPLETMNHILNFAIVTFAEINILVLLLPDGCISGNSYRGVLRKLMI